jgi:DNA-binding winged helix-turn-helix (wHTH) protein
MMRGGLARVLTNSFVFVDFFALCGYPIREASERRAMKLRFGDCVLDTDSRRLFREDREVHLSPKGFALMSYLIDSRPRALSKLELHEHVWPATFVSDDSLAKLVTEIRHVIGDEARDAKWLRTVHGFGYAFTDDGIVEIRDDDHQQLSEPARRLQWPGREVLLRKAETIIGRDLDVDVHLESALISRHHARISIDGPNVLIEDLGSRNGTYVQGRRVDAPMQLAHGDEIRIGPILLTFRVSSPTAPTEPDGVPTGDAGSGSQSV